MKVPEDVSVIGFDDTGLAEMVMPLLTTVRLPAAAAGAAAVRMLLDVVDGRDGAVDARVELGSRTRHPVDDDTAGGGTTAVGGGG